mmetsp:Transcript_101225/g.291539  ORF Transcript_101225/g.291539 Transcript_101225/m.291539 type:complete len:266 (-) Transcript_101225:262-1059(-)
MALHFFLKLLLRLARGDLLLALIEQEVLALPIPAFREGLHVAFDAAAYHELALRLEVRVLPFHLGEQRGETLTTDTPCAIHHHLFTLQLVLDLRHRQPLRQLVAVPDLGIDEFRTAGGRLEVADGGFVMVPDIDDDGVRFRHHLVVVMGLEVLRLILLQRWSHGNGQSVGDQLRLLLDGQALKPLRVVKAVSELEVCLLEHRVPIPEALAEGPDAFGGARQGAVQALRRATATACDAMLPAELDDEGERLSMLLRRPGRLDVLVE